ncbi:hypothetical protein FH5_00185 [Priestia endophytica]|jgi:AraC-type transcriptional regulator N-terminus|nr:AraC family transcriptional regulator N-terminal domain-containing protein [Priestia endophytica]RPK14750.1 hypothetical protein FH5_00185 [Priestia endophytica]
MYCCSRGKEIFLAQERFRNSPADYLIATVDLPATAQVIEASTDVPYLSLKFEFTPSQILEVLCDAEIRVNPKKDVKRAMFVSPVDSSMLKSVIRLARLLDSPKDIPVLAPLFTKEILYRVLQGPHGSRLGQIAIEGSYTYRMRNVIEHVMNNYEKSFKIEELAEIANMSVSSLHRHFKPLSIPKTTETARSPEPVIIRIGGCSRCCIPGRL